MNIRSFRPLAAVIALLVAAGSAPAAQAGSATYTYDALGRVVKVAYANGTVITYTYDAAGNRTRTVTTGAR